MSYSDARDALSYYGIYLRTRSAVTDSENQIVSSQSLPKGTEVDHGCIIEEGVHVCLGAIVKGENRIEKCSKIEAGEVVERGQYPL